MLYHVRSSVKVLYQKYNKKYLPSVHQRGKTVVYIYIYSSYDAIHIMSTYSLGTAGPSLFSYLTSANPMEGSLPVRKLSESAEVFIEVGVEERSRGFSNILKSLQIYKTVGS